MLMVAVVLGKGSGNQEEEGSFSVFLLVLLVYLDLRFQQWGFYTEKARPFFSI